MLVKPADPKRPPDAAALQEAFGAFSCALDLAVAAAGSLAPADRDRPAASGAAPAPPEITPEIVAGLKAAAEWGDVAALAEMGRDLAAQGGEVSATGKRILRMAEDFDFEGILKLVAELNATR
jgi:hypothetical protein